MSVTFNIVNCLWISVFIDAVGAYYLIGDYYMDSGHSKTFGGVCGETVMDDCLYLNSHVHNLRLSKYPRNNDCWMIADAGAMPGARYRVYIEMMILQLPSVDGMCFDYVEITDGLPTNTSSVTRVYCGDQWTNETWIATERQLLVRFHSDALQEMQGFKIKLVRSEPLPCVHKEWLCRHENRCIDGRLVCDGTHQCLGGDDESDCNACKKFVVKILALVWQKFIGKILALGTSGVIGVSMGVCGTLVLTVTVISVICCCKRFKCLLFSHGEQSCKACLHGRRHKVVDGQTVQQNATDPEVCSSREEAS